MDKHEISAEEWNSRHAPGIGVLVKLDDGKLWHTKTRSEAWELSHGKAVVMLKGKPGCYDLQRVTPMERQDTPLA